MAATNPTHAPCRWDSHNRLASVVGVTRAIVALVVCVLATAVDAAASSIVYVKTGNVWISSPDGSLQRQVTKNGSPSNPYSSPSQADDGTIVAARGDLLFRMNQQGSLLNAPVPTPSGDQPLEADVSPNGRIVAFDRLGPVAGQLVTSFAYSDRPTPPLAFASVHASFPSWIGNGRVLLTSANTVYYDDLGAATTVFPEAPTPWFVGPLFDPSFGITDQSHDADLSRSGGKLALVHSNNGATSLLFYAMASTPPAAPTPTCRLVDPVGKFADPSWAPDGSSLAWAEDNGVWVGAPNEADCRTFAVAPRLLLAGGSQPDWGTANVQAPKRDTAAPTTRILAGPRGTTGMRATTFTFASNEPATFQCKLDGQAWARCGSPKRLKNLAPGLHIFRVRARDSAGNIDRTPAVRIWRV